MNVDRRLFVVGGAGLFAGGAVTAIFRGGAVDRVQAGEIGSFSIGNVETELGGPPEEVELVVEGTIEWEGHESIDDIEAELFIEYSGVEEAFGTYVVFDPDAAGDEEFELARDLLTHDALDGDDFDVDSGETEDLHFDARLEVVAIDESGGEEEIAVQEDSFVIEVTGAGITLTVVAEGEVVITE